MFYKDDMASKIVFLNPLRLTLLAIPIVVLLNSEINYLKGVV